MGGANSVDNLTLLDPTVFLLPGMMSTYEDPLSAYTCIAETSSCPGYRRPPGAVQGSDGDFDGVCHSHSFGVRCGSCQSDFYLDEEEGCLACPAYHGLARTARVLGVSVILMFFLYRAYVLIGQDDFPPKVMFWIAVAFLQYLKELEGLPVHWPDSFLSIFKWCRIIDIFDFYQNFMGIQEECIFGSSVVQAMARDLVKPLSPVALFIPLALVYRLLARRHLNIYLAIATVADTMLAVFVQVSVMVLYAFPTDEMPNGSLFLTYHPRVRHGSLEWEALIPLTVVGVLVYVAGFLAFLIWGLRSLPRLNSQASELADLYAFFGDYRPVMYWWTGVVLGYDFCFALSNAAFVNPYIRVHLTLIFTIIVALLEVIWLPGMTRETQNAAIASQLGIAILLALCTVFQDVVEKYRDMVAILVVCELGLVVVFITSRVFHSNWRAEAREEKVQKMKRLVPQQTLRWMSTFLYEDLGQALTSVRKMDHYDEQLLLTWTHTMLYSLLGKPLERDGSCSAFAHALMEGHRLVHRPDLDFHVKFESSLKRSRGRKLTSQSSVKAPPSDFTPQPAQQEHSQATNLGLCWGVGASEASLLSEGCRLVPLERSPWRTLTFQSSPLAPPSHFTPQPSQQEHVQAYDLDQVYDIDAVEAFAPSECVDRKSEECPNMETEDHVYSL